MVYPRGFRVQVTTGLCRLLSCQYGIKGVFGEADDQRCAATKHGSPQRAGTSQNQAGDFVIDRSILFQVEVQRLLSFRDIQLVHALQQFESCVSFVFDFLRVDLLGFGDRILRKKLLRLFAGDSSWAVVAPVDFRHHVSFPVLVES